MINLSLLRASPVTVALLVISGLVAMMSQIGSQFDAITPFLISEYIRPTLPEIMSGQQLWRLITPIFVHFGLMHLLFNSMMTFQLGSLLEPKMGSLPYGLLIVVMAVGSNLGQYFFTGPFFGGLSGILYGLFGYFWMSSRYNPRFGLRINPNAVTMLMGWFVLCWFDKFFDLFGNIAIANEAHTVGLVLGMLAALLGVWLNQRHLV